MAVPFISSKNYIDEFNAKEYLQTSYAEGTGVLFGDWTNFALQNLHEIFTEGGVRGDTLLDFGTGASIYQLLSACEVFDKIIVSDLLEKNRIEFQKWLKNDANAFDWTHIIKFVCKLEGTFSRENCEKKAEKLRSKVKEVLKCDALKRNPYDPVIVQPVDCLLSTLCLDIVTTDMKIYIDILKNFKDLIKPGGHIVVLGTLNATFYHAGKKRFNVMSMNKELLETAYKEAGYKIEKAVYTPRIDKSRVHIADFQGEYFIHARKPM